MATWLRSREGAVCPATQVPIATSGSKYCCRPSPCVRYDGTRCQHLSNYYAGTRQATVQCRFGGA